MCGLTGIFGDITHKDIEAFKQLLYVSSLRGMDSTGIAVFTKRGDDDPFGATILKTVGSSYNLIDTKGFDKALQLSNKKVLMGHTRAATRGVIRASNAHPFEFSHYVGAHNGTLDWSANRELPNHQYFDTDSEALIFGINENGVKETINKMEGAWALSLVDKERGVIQFLRNDKRDLCYCFNEAHDVMYWASEYRFLRFVLDRCDIKLFEDKVFRFTDDVLFSYDIPRKMNLKIGNPRREEVKGKEHKTYSFPSRSGNTGSSWTPARAAAERVFGNNDNKKAKEQTNVVRIMSKLNIQKPENSDAHMSISQLPKFHHEFYDKKGKKRNQVVLFKHQVIGCYWPKNTFEKHTSGGCAFCTEVPQWGDNILFCNRVAFLCQKCAGDPGIEEAIACGDPQLPVKGALEMLNDPLPTIN